MSTRRWQATMACRERRRHDGATRRCTATRQCIEYRRAAVLLSMQSQWRDNARIFPIFRKMSDFPEFFSQQPLKIFRKFLNRIVA
jgi:hypothetical protein